VEAGADLLLVLQRRSVPQLGHGFVGGFLPYGNCERSDRIAVARASVAPRAGRADYCRVFAADENDRPGDSAQTAAIAGRRRRSQLAGDRLFWDGRYRELVEDEGLGTRCEAEMLALAHFVGHDSLRLCLDSSGSVLLSRSGCRRIDPRFGA